MTRINLCVIIVSLSFINSLNAATAPAVFWNLKSSALGKNSPSESNLNVFNGENFAELLVWKTEHGSVPLIAFGMEALSLEDLSSQNNNVNSAEPFPELRKLTESSAETLLFPAVDSVSEAIAILKTKGYEVYEIEAGAPLPNFKNTQSILVVNDKASISMDGEIERVFSWYTKQYPNVLGLLWGKQSSWSAEEENNEVQKRVKRQATTPAPEPAELFVLQQNGLLMVFRSVTVKVKQMETREIVQQVVYTKADGTVTTNGTDVVDAVLKFGPAKPTGLTIDNFDLSMQFTKGVGGYWVMSSATANLVGFETSSFSFTSTPLIQSTALAAPEDWSFHCSTYGPLYPGIVKPGNHTFFIDLNGFQVQPFTKNTTSFDTAYECVGFFSIGILSGIFITLILISVLTWGLMMIMSVKTMDRFDDPKGKPISFGGND